MFKIVVSSCLIALAAAGIIHHDTDGHHHATSYQHVKIENYHAVPVYIKKEHAQFLEHPVSAGHVDHGVQVHHGDGKHDPGFAIESHHAGHEDSGVGHLLAESHDEGHQVAIQEEVGHHEGLGAYAGHDSGYGGHEGYAQLESHGHDNSGYELHGHGSYQALGHGGHHY